MTGSFVYFMINSNDPKVSDETEIVLGEPEWPMLTFTNSIFLDQSPSTTPENYDDLFINYSTCTTPGDLSWNELQNIRDWVANLDVVNELKKIRDEYRQLKTAHAEYLRLKADPSPESAFRLNQLLQRCVGTPTTVEDRTRVITYLERLQERAQSEEVKQSVGSTLRRHSGNYSFCTDIPADDRREEIVDSYLIESSDQLYEPASIWLSMRPTHYFRQKDNQDEYSTRVVKNLKSGINTENATASTFQIATHLLRRAAGDISLLQEANAYFQVFNSQYPFDYLPLSRVCESLDRISGSLTTQEIIDSTRMAKEILLNLAEAKQE